MPRKRKSKLRRKLPSRVKKTRTKRNARGRSQHPELWGLGAIALGLFLGAVLYFGWTGHIIYSYAIPMAVCSIAGATIGARLAIAKGSRFVRIFFLVIVGALIAKLAQS